jgi:opacity protein-like surface antigen
MSLNRLVAASLYLVLAASVLASAPSALAQSGDWVDGAGWTLTVGEMNRDGSYDAEITDEFGYDQGTVLLRADGSGHWLDLNGIYWSLRWHTYTDKLGNEHLVTKIWGDVFNWVHPDSVERREDW